ncbi:hypothetical protein SteCoe_36374 [Stentor coeruleus]|uniref:Uncharacterized protein n=1 Tax=Stentor coeruleus TaxID=5963 RepID=A0A1R2AQ98_9CILI|nr:hypothetical protein SteCoe_36374 [Stentor coeruleus]
MGINLSTVCCTCCNTRLVTEEDDFQGIRYEIRHKYKNQNSLPFQDCLYRMNSEESLLHLLDKPQMDYLTCDNKELQCSAILNVNDIPKLPTPNRDNLDKVICKQRRSISLFAPSKKRTAYGKISRISEFYGRDEKVTKFLMLNS